MPIARFLISLTKVSIGTLALGAVGWAGDDEPADHHPSVAPDLTTVALAILAAILFATNLFGVWWLALSLGG